MSEPTLNRFFAPGPLASGTTIPLPDSEAHHARSVLRHKPGDAVTVFDGQGGSADATIARVERRAVTVELGEVRVSPRLAPAMHLAFAVPKGKRLDWLLEKATELGVASLRPIVFERSVAGGEELSAGKRDRWEGHILSAAKQCGLDWLPELRSTAPLAEFLADGPAGLCVFGDLGEGARAFHTLAGLLPAARDVTVVVGAEGGLTAAERETLATAGAWGVRLGGTTLRIETAAVALLAGLWALTEPAPDA